MPLPLRGPSNKLAHNFFMPFRGLIDRRVPLVCQHVILLNIRVDLGLSSSSWYSGYVLLKLALRCV